MCDNPTSHASKIPMAVPQGNIFGPMLCYLSVQQFTTPENTITYHNALCLSPQKFQFLLGVKMAPRETEKNAYAKFWGDKQRALRCVVVFSGVVNDTQNL